MGVQLRDQVCGAPGRKNVFGLDSLLEAFEFDSGEGRLVAQSDKFCLRDVMNLHHDAGERSKDRCDDQREPAQQAGRADIPEFGSRSVGHLDWLPGFFVVHG